MSRVKAVVSRSIAVDMYDINLYDVLYIYGDERDPIVVGISRSEGKVKLHYKDRQPTEKQKELGITPVQTSRWMDPEDPDSSSYIFIHDLKNERAEFNVTTCS